MLFSETETKMPITFVRNIGSEVPTKRLMNSMAVCLGKKSEKQWPLNYDLENL